MIPSGVQLSVAVEQSLGEFGSIFDGCSVEWCRNPV